MWFPEIFERFNEYEKTFPNSTASVCTISGKEATNDHNNHPWFLECDPSIDSKVFLDTIIIGVSCIPTSVSLSFLMKKLGKKYVLSKWIIIINLNF